MNDDPREEAVQAVFNNYELPKDCFLREYWERIKSDDPWNLEEQANFNSLVLNQALLLQELLSYKSVKINSLVIDNHDLLSGLLSYIAKELKKNCQKRYTPFYVEYRRIVSDIYGIHEQLQKLNLDYFDLEYGELEDKLIEENQAEGVTIEVLPRLIEHAKIICESDQILLGNTDRLNGKKKRIPYLGYKADSIMSFAPKEMRITQKYCLTFDFMEAVGEFDFMSVAELDRIKKDKDRFISNYINSFKNQLKRNPNNLYFQRLFNYDLYVDEDED